MDDLALWLITASRGKTKFFPTHIWTRWLGEEARCVFPHTHIYRTEFSPEQGEEATTQVSSLQDVLEDTRYVNSVEIIVPVDGLGIEVEHVIFRSVHHHRGPQALHVCVVKASSPCMKGNKVNSETEKRSTPHFIKIYNFRSSYCVK